MKSVLNCIANGIPVFEESSGMIMIISQDILSGMVLELRIIRIVYQIVYNNIIPVNTGCGDRLP